MVMIKTRSTVPENKQVLINANEIMSVKINHKEKESVIVNMKNGSAVTIWGITMEEFHKQIQEGKTA